MPESISIKQINVYPVKGCSAITLNCAAVLGTGLPYDRQWMVVTDVGKFITQRQFPKLCQVSVSLPPEALLGCEWSQLPPGAALVLSATGMPDLTVPLTDPAAAVPAEAIKRVTVWEWTGAAADEGDAAAQWFSSYLGKPARLVRHLGSPAAAVPDTVRPTDPEFAPGHEVKFADGFPLLVALEENLSALNAEMGASGAGGSSLPMDRFRPNIVLAGAGSAWEDDGWQSIAIEGAGTDAGVLLQYVKPCDRCKVPTINQETAEVGDEPLNTLGKIRSGKVLGWSAQRKAWTHAVFFGWNAAVVKQGSISVGDAVAVVARSA